MGARGFAVELFSSANMKFEETFQQLQVADWKEYYFNYVFVKVCFEQLTGVERRRRLINVSLQVGSREAWIGMVESEAMRVADFLRTGLANLEQSVKQLEDLSTSMFLRKEQSNGEAVGKLPTKQEEFHYLQSCGRAWMRCLEIRRFAELNYVALFRILRKHDRRLNVSDGLSVHLPSIVRRSQLVDNERFDKLDSRVRQISTLCPSCLGFSSDISMDSLQLAVGLCEDLHDAPPGQGALGSTDSLSNHMRVFIGLLLGLLITLVFILALPPLDIRTFDASYLMAPFPVFLTVWAMILVLWCVGLVISMCESHHINYRFLLGVDPRSTVRSFYFFKWGAALTCLWLSDFGLYVVDYKWEVMPEVLPERGESSRSSALFVVYPIFLIVCVCLGMVLRSQIFRYGYKTALLRSLARTAMSPFFAVTFADNVMGDVLTSLTKPAVDMVSGMCYLFSKHPQTHAQMQNFEMYGDTCPQWGRSFLIPVVMALPFYFRAMQCSRRYYDTHETRHLLNFGKYCASLLVIIVSHITHDPLPIIVVEIIATMYSFLWDIALDWGLKCRDLFPWFAGDISAGRAVSPRRASFVPIFGSARTAPGKHKYERRFSPKVYMMCAMLDLVARLTW